MAESYKIGPNLVGAIYDVIQANKDAGGGRPPPTRIPTSFGEGPPEFRGVRIGTFDTAAWSIGTDNTVTLTNVGVTGYTVLATNIFTDIAASNATQSCAIAKDGTAWYLVQANPSQLVVGYTASSWSKNSAAAIQVYTGELGMETGTGQYVTAFNGFAAIGSGKRVMLGNTGGSNWHVISADCSA